MVSEDFKKKFIEFTPRQYDRSMEQTQIVSVRIPKNLLASIDKFASKHPYWKRSGIINGLLYHAMIGTSEKELYEAVYEGHKHSINWLE